MKKISPLIIVSLILCAQAAFAAMRYRPALEIMRKYLFVDQDSVIVSPYMVNLMALDLLKKNEVIETVEAYINWYLDNLNCPDKYGLIGSIYDQKFFRDGRIESLHRFDSADSYAATFISLMLSYYKTTGNKNIIKYNRQNLQDIAYIISYLQDKDGLVVALPGTDVKYLMDNCEVYAGVCAFIELSADFEWHMEGFYENVRDGIKAGIYSRLYDDQTKEFGWYADAYGRNRLSWDTFYPDSYAQLFPVLYGLLPGHDDVKEIIWIRFHEHHQEKLPDLPVEQKIVYEWTREAIQK